MDMNGDKSTSHQPTSQPTTCKNSTCTFFGSSSSEGYCSVCYKDILKKKNGPPPGVSQVTQVVQAKSSKINIQNESTIPQESSISQASSSDNTSKSNTEILATKSNDDQEIRPKTPENITEAFKQPAGSTVPENSSVATPSSTKSTPSKPKKRKCQMCKKKIGLTGFECRCGKLFCSTHRYADIHDCTFDYKEDGREKIRKANPTCTDDKITRF